MFRNVHDISLTVGSWTTASRGARNIARGFGVAAFIRGLRLRVICWSLATSGKLY